MIEKRGDKFVVLSKHGRVLGTHNTKPEAEAQLSAIEISKARAAGHKIPQPKKPSIGSIAGRGE